MRTTLRLVSSVVLGVTVLLFTSTQAYAGQVPRGEFDANVVYGEDNRKDWYDSPDAGLRELALSTVALVETRNIGATADGLTEIKGKHYGKTNQLCADEKFYDQTAAAFCSGFLVGPNKIVTAGHCVATEVDCARTNFVFGYAVKSVGELPTHVASGEVYKCAKVVHSQAEGKGADYAIIELDREVVGHTPLNLRKEGNALTGDELVVIGHPAGLPSKIADGAVVRTEAKNGFFVANLDTYGGNSGSAVFNTRTKEVEGILVRGETDYVWKDGCVRSKVCASNECRGEDVTAIANVLNYL
ncbi:MAG: serine protease [Bdellovibrionota bacterium]